MNDGAFKKQHVESFTVVGLQVRTTNANEMSGSGSIGQLWGKVMQGKALDEVPNRIGSDVLAIYSNYESDQNGAYDFLLGVRVRSADKVPNGLVVKQVHAGSFDVFNAEGTDPGDITLNLWKQVWALEQSQTIVRAYRVDFEVHHSPATNDPKHAAVDLFISVKDEL
jgi:predicted transcriptional regulator YdeE